MDTNTHVNRGLPSNEKNEVGVPALPPSLPGRKPRTHADCAPPPAARAHQRVLRSPDVSRVRPALPPSPLASALSQAVSPGLGLWAHPSRLFFTKLEGDSFQMSAGSHHPLLSVLQRPLPTALKPRSSQQPAGSWVSLRLLLQPPSPGSVQCSHPIFAVRPHAKRVPASGLRMCERALCPGRSSQAGAISPRWGRAPTPATLPFPGPLVSLGTHSLPPTECTFPYVLSPPLPHNLQ